MTNGNTAGMNTAKITISLDQRLLTRLDYQVKAGKFASRSQAFQSALEEKLRRMRKARLAQACAKLDPNEEQALADMGLASEAEQWPPY
jgi:Arc/MetJ-type ribon-helix-helix transcriptional regulator